MPGERTSSAPVAATPRTMLNDLPGASRKPCTRWRCFHVGGRPEYLGGKPRVTPTSHTPGTAYEPIRRMLCGRRRATRSSTTVSRPWLVNRSSPKVTGSPTRAPAQAAPPGEGAPNGPPRRGPSVAGPLLPHPADASAAARATAANAAGITRILGVGTPEGYPSQLAHRVVRSHQ